MVGKREVYNISVLLIYQHELYYLYLTKLTITSVVH